MVTAKWVFFALAVLVILPVLFLNMKKFVITREGQKPKIGHVRIVLVALACIALGLFVHSLYSFTINYQPRLVLERFTRAYFQVENLKITSVQFEKIAKDISQDSLIAQMKEKDFFTLAGKGITEFQFGEKMSPQYYVGVESIPQIEGVTAYSAQPVYVLCRAKAGGHRAYLLFQIRELNGYWKIEKITRATEEAAQYVLNRNLIKEEYKTKWLPVN